MYSFDGILKKFTVFWITLIVIVVVLLSLYSSLTGMYNGLVTRHVAVKTQRAEIETQMQRRADLVPNVVAATRGAMSQEKDVYEDVAKSYAAFNSAQSGSSERMDAGAALGNALRGYLVVAQQYPTLRSLDIIRDLTVTLEGTENRITVARSRYNEAVQQYEQTRRSFPTNIMANMSGFTEEKQFQANSKGNAVPSVNLE